MSEQKNNHTLLKVAGVTVAAGTAAYAGFGYYVFRNAFDLQNSALYTGKTGLKRLTSGYGEKNEWFAHSVRDDEFLDSYDGLKLHALRITNHEDGHKWLVLAHGIGAYSGALLDYLYEADHRGFNILAPDARGCGMSEGRYTGLGWTEHYDLISWINYLVSLDQQAEIAVVGMNAGGTAVMNLVGDYLPSNVKCAVEDGGFSGIREILLDGIRKYCRIEGAVFMPVINLYAKTILGFSINDVSTSRQLKQSSTPMLFVHGTDDDVIPSSMLFDNYYACAAEKDLYAVQGAGFNETSSAEGYYDKVFGFIGKYIETE